MSGRDGRLGGTHVPLYVKSHFSFLEGASEPEALVDRAADLGLDAVALTDRDGVYGVVRAHQRAKARGVRLLLGATVSVDDGTRIVLQAMDRGGWANLCRLLTRGRLRCAKGESVVRWVEVAEHAEGLVALWGGEPSLLCRADVAEGVVERRARALVDAFGDRLYAMVVRHRTPDEPTRERLLRERARRFGLPTVAASEVRYADRSRRPVADVLTCVRHGVTLETAGRLLAANATHGLVDDPSFRVLFADDPDSVTRTREVAEKAAFSLDRLRYRYPSERLPDGRTSMQHLTELTWQGARDRYGGSVPDDVGRQLERELAVIDELDYPGYFLTMVELVRFCREHGILCQGRGSAANSAVCYCLGVTAVDPVRMGLLFERFLSRERAEPPDIDLDIAHGRREEVIQHVYERYGRTHAAMVANVIRYRTKSAIRDVGKALGIPAPRLERVAKLIHWSSPMTAETLRQAGLDPDEPRHRHLMRLTEAVLDTPRHLSIHPGGFLLGHEAVHDLVPIENATMADRTVCQWDKYDVEALGLFKVDLLGLGALTQIDRALELMREHKGVDLTMATIPAEDPETYAMMSRGETVGVFQIESRAQMAMLPRLKPASFYDLVIEISIVRPGPITGDMVHPYLRRRNGEEPIVYPHPSLEPVLRKTLGVPLFQEQVMRLAVVAADYTPGEADQLRRDMGAWRASGKIEAHRERLIRRMVAKGIEPQFAERVFSQIRGFGEYGFPESHAASFALISYATAWLKCHHPDVFFCAMLNAQPLGFYSPATLVDEAKREGLTVLPIDVTRSGWDTALVRPADASAEASGPTPGEGPFALRLGLRWVKHLREEAGMRLVEARQARPFEGLDDFVRRAAPPKDALHSLAEGGALDAFGMDRRQAIWAARGLHEVRGLALPTDLSAGQGRSPVLPELRDSERIQWDYRATGMSPHKHPLAPFRARLSHAGFPSAAEVRGLTDGANVRYVGLVITRQRPGTAKGVMFLTMEDATGFVNVVLWRKIAERFPALSQAGVLLGVSGTIQSQSGVVHLVADELWEPDLGEPVPEQRSRDFR